MADFDLISDFRPTGDQPLAIDQLSAGIKAGLKHQTLLGVTGSGKTFSMANVVQQIQRPTLVTLGWGGTHSWNDPPFNRRQSQ